MRPSSANAPIRTHADVADLSRTPVIRRCANPCPGNLADTDNVVDFDDLPSSASGKLSIRRHRVDDQPVSAVDVISGSNDIAICQPYTGYWIRQR